MTAPTAAGVEVNLACGDTITVQTMPAIGAYRFCIHCDAKKKVTGVPAPAPAPVTARDLIEEASADWEHWSAGTWIGDRLRAEDPRTPLEVLDAGVIDQAAFWAIVNRAAPCGCWSCNGGCGNSVLDDGLVTPDENNHPICRACREAADVIDTTRQGIKVSYDAYGIRLDSDVWGRSYAASHLTPASARALARSLNKWAAHAELIEASV